MNFKGILGCMIATVLAYVVVNAITLGASAAWLGVLGSSLSIGVFIGIMINAFERKFASPIVVGTVVALCMWIAVMLIFGAAFGMPVLLRLIVPTLVFAGLGAFAGFGYKLGSRL